MPWWTAQGPFIGRNTKADSSQLDPREASSEENILLDSGRLDLRDGRVTRVTPSLGRVGGIIDFPRASGSVTQVVKVGAKLYRLDNWVATEIASSGFSTTDLLSGAVVNDRLYLCDGTAFRVTDGTATFPAQLSKPTTALQVTTASGTGVLTGTYDYKYTFYSTTWGQESPASVPSATVKPKAQNVEVSNWDLGIQSGDARIDRVRIYRRRVDAGEETWRLVSETVVPAAIGDPFTDSTLDNDVSIIFSAPDTYTEELPAMSFLAYQAGVLFQVPKLFPTRVYYTLADRPWVTTSFFEVKGSTGDAEPIRGLASFRGVLVVLTENSIWLVSGNSTATFASRKTNARVGCRSHHSLCQYGDRLCFLAEDGFYEFDGENTRKLSSRIDPDLLARNYSRDQACVAVHDFAHNAIWWSYSSAAATQNDLVAVYFWQNSRLVEADSWSLWRFGGDAIASLGLITDPLTRKRRVALGSELGKVDEHTGDADQNLPIRYEWTTGKMDFGNPTREKSLQECMVECEKQMPGQRFEVWGLLDGGDDTFPIGIHDEDREIFRRRVRRRARDFRLSIRAEHRANQIRIVSIMQEGFPAGRAHK